MALEKKNQGQYDVKDTNGSEGADIVEPMKTKVQPAAKKDCGCTDWGSHWGWPGTGLHGGGWPAMGWPDGWVYGGSYPGGHLGAGFDPFVSGYGTFHGHHPHFGLHPHIGPHPHFGHHPHFPWVFPWFPGHWWPVHPHWWGGIPGHISHWGPISPWGQTSPSARDDE